jgi:hypothetical protein
MADGSPAGPADGLTPEQEEVRRLLADARHVDPMPDDVVDRLDQVLAGLATESGDDRVAAPPPPWCRWPPGVVTARRPRSWPPLRWWPSGSGWGRSSGTVWAAATSAVFAR